MKNDFKRYIINVKKYKINDLKSKTLKVHQKSCLTCKNKNYVYYKFTVVVIILKYNQYHFKVNLL